MCRYCHGTDAHKYVIPVAEQMNDKEEEENMQKSEWLLQYTIFKIMLRSV